MISVCLLLDFMRFSRGFSPRFFASFEKLADFALSFSRSFERLADFADFADFEKVTKRDEPFCDFFKICEIREICELFKTPLNTRREICELFKTPLNTRREIRELFKTCEKTRRKSASEKHKMETTSDETGSSEVVL